MNVKRFSGFDLSIPDDEFEDVPEETRNELDITRNKPFLNFLSRDGKDISIRRIYEYDDEIIYVYYDEISPAKQDPKKQSNRFANIDIV
jgi:hypothetical protein